MDDFATIASSPFVTGRNISVSFSLTLTWTGQQTNPKNHFIEFGSGQSIYGSAAAEYLGAIDKVNPEESLLAALSCYHMLSFLTIAEKMRLNMMSYIDHCEAKLGKNSQGRLAITQIKLSRDSPRSIGRGFLNRLPQPNT